MNGLPIALRRWLAMMVIVVPVSLLVFTIFARRVAPPIEGPHVRDTLLDSLKNVVGFYSGYIAIAATVMSLLHTYASRRFGATSTAGSVGLGALLGILALLPQAAAFGTGYWAWNVIVGALAGACYGLVVTIPWFR